ncbi:hypothetical protein NE237_014670 [Protea cynaroides]|uniref:Uncharacterized protein n=1 Tax=Protea cynaroides TaxID=273540 RepID=A0A9Q0KCL4_9MAGN|nr:hypothetical protein NE237_014670 [Protea cynaroides]
MSVVSSFAPPPDVDKHLLQNESIKIIHKSANFHPNIWGDHFITNAPSDHMVTNRISSYDACLEQVEELKEEVRRMLAADANDSSKKLRLIDSLQRLGVAYHFEGEIEDALKHIHDAPNGFDHEMDLYTMALQFLLLRQRYNVPCGSFKKELIKDVPSVLCLYEASYTRIHGEDILEQFYNYISVYQQVETRNETLLKLAKLDFNSLQSIHKQEDRLMDCYFWIVGVYFDAHYSLARMNLTKIIVTPQFRLNQKCE